MPSLEQIQQFLWIFPDCVSFVILLLLLRRGDWREMPVFTAYLASIVFANTSLGLIRAEYPAAYFYCYWTADAFTALLGLGLIYEIFRSVLLPFDSVRKIGLALFRWFFILLLLLAAATYRSNRADEIDPWVAVLINMELSLRILEAGLLVLLFTFASSLGLTWKHHLLGLAGGFSLFIAAELAVVGARSFFGSSTANIMYQSLKPISFNCAALIWLAYIWKAKSTVPIAKLPSAVWIVDWNRTLAGYLSR